MESASATRARARSRDEAMRLLQRLTVGSSIAAFVGVGVFAVISAQTIPGTAAAPATASSSTNRSTDTGTWGSESSSATIQSSSGVSPSFTQPVAVSGGSR